MVSEAKKQQVQALVQDIQQYPIIGLVNLQSLPAQQLQKMRALLLKKDVKIIMARKKLLQLALANSKLENIDQLTAKIKGMPAFIFSKSNPFTLYGTLQRNKSEAPAKAGQIAPKDITVKAGATNFAPGPIISELAAVGIKTKVEDGKLAIIADVIVVKEDEEISSAVAETLKRLDIKPMEIGLDLVAVWEKGTIFDAKQLHIDEAEYSANFTQAASWAMNLAMEMAYPTADTTEMLLQKAFREAKAISLDQNIITDETAAEILAKVERQALAVKDAGNIEVGAIAEPQAEEPTPVEEPKAESTPVEEPKAEPTPVEEPKAEPTPVEPKAEPTPVEEPKAESTPVEEPKAEPTPVEEPKAEPTPVEEPKAEPTPVEPKAEPTPVEEPKAEPTPVEPKAEPTPVEEPKAESTPVEPKAEPTPVEPKAEEPDFIAEPPKKSVSVKSTEKTIEEMPTHQPVGGSIPSAESLIAATKQKFSGQVEEPKVTAESLLQEDKATSTDEKPKESDKTMEESEKLFDQLKKQGTLRKDS
jgi:large subunit ribosomal protein L10